MPVMRKGMLVEYGLSIPPLALVFDFNPQQISRSRTITIKTGASPGLRGGYDFTTPLETPRVAQGVDMQAETFSIDILLDATDKLNAGDPIAGKSPRSRPPQGSRPWPASTSAVRPRPSSARSRPRC